MASSKPQLDEVLRLGQDVYNIKHSVSRGTWRKIVRDAHTKKLTVRGYLSNAPDPLKERTKSGIQDEATGLINKLYKPQEQELDSRTSQINAVDRLRQQDNAKFNEWLGQQTSSLQSAAKAADEALAQRVANLHSQVTDAWKNTQAQANTNAAGTAGTVSNTANSNALQQLAQAGEAANETNAANGQQAITQSNNALSQMNVGAAAMLAQTAVNDAQRQSDTWKALADVSDEKSKLKLSKAADAAKMVQDLLTQEISKAQYNQDTSIAADKLGVEQDKLDYQKTKDTRDYNLAKNKFNLQKWIAQNKATVDQAKIDLGYDKIKADQGKAAADEKLRKWVERYRAKKAQERQDAKDTGTDIKPPTGSEKKVSQTAFRTVATIRGQLEDLHKRYGDSGKTKQGRTFRQVMRSRGYDDASIDVAEAWRRAKKLKRPMSAADLKKAEAIGMLDPSTLLT